MHKCIVLRNVLFLGIWLWSISLAEAVPHRWTPTLGSPFGINTHLLLWDGNQKAIKAVVDAGISWIRVDFNWHTLEPKKGQYNWKISDGLINVAIKYKLNVFATLAYAPKWAAKYPNPPDKTYQSGPKNVADWERFVKAVVNRYKGKISHWGIWNEPNLDHFLYVPKTVAQKARINEYVQNILLPGIKAVRATDKDAIVIAFDLAHLAGYRSNPITKPKMHSWNIWFDEILKVAGSQLDVISHHTYQGDYMRFMDGTPHLWEAPSFMSYMQKHKINKPIWLTEIGWQSQKVSEATQAANFKTMLTTMLSRKWWFKVFPYELKDDPNIKEKWGIVRADWTRKASWSTYRDFIKAHQPVANAGSDRSVKANTTVTFDGSASKDPDGQLVKYVWDFDARNGLQADATGVKAAHRFTNTGTYEVTLTVTDNHGISIGHRIKVTVSGGGGQPPVKGYQVLYADTSVKIDGNLSEWAKAKVITLGSKHYQRITENWGGVGDLSAQAMWMWTQQGLYFAARVNDNNHTNTHSSDLWKADSIQIAIDADNDRKGPGFDGDGDYEFGVALANGKARWERTAGPSSAPNVPLQVAVIRTGNTTVYEVLIPAFAIKPLVMRASSKVSLNFLINDHDGKGRKGWLEWTPGIGRSKDPSLYNQVTLMAGTPSQPEKPVQPEPPSTNEPGPSQEPSGQPDAGPSPDPGSTSPDQNNNAPDPGSTQSDTPGQNSPDKGNDPGNPGVSDSGGGDEALRGGCGCQSQTSISWPLLAFLLLLPFWRRCQRTQ